MLNKRLPYRDKLSSMVSWGHWFAFFNILFCLLIGSRYLAIADWPSSLLGRIYALVSWLGHFSFIVFALYLVLIFPLSFVAISQRFMRFVSAAVATTGITLLILDSAVFNRFHIHLNPIVWELITSSESSDLTRHWQLIFINAPLIFLVEMLLGTWIWNKLRSLSRRSDFIARPAATLFIACFFIMHLLYSWADANFYRPITMQRSSLPLSYPMTVKSFLEKHGWLNGEAFNERLAQQGDLNALPIEYPLSPLSYQDAGRGQNILIITADSLSAADLKLMPQTQHLAKDNLQFLAHYSNGYQENEGLFGLFYGISPSYLNSVIAYRKPSSLLKALEEQHYQVGIFSANGFNSPLYRQALLTDYALPIEPTDKSDNHAISTQWQRWFEQQAQDSLWFSYVNYHNNSASQLDKQIANVVAKLKSKNQLSNTVIIITAEKAVYNAKNTAFVPQPLLIIWPDSSSKTINKATSHQDIMATLMQQVLHVTTPLDDYSQGENLFSTVRDKDWLLTRDGGVLNIIKSDYTVRLKDNGSYTLIDNASGALLDKKVPLDLLLDIFAYLSKFNAE